MSKYVINDTTLTAIGDAIRAKGNTEDKILVSNLATAITNLPTGGGNIEVEPIVLTGIGSYSCGGNIAGTYIDLFGDTISTNDLTNISAMFQHCTAKKIPFDLNCKSNTDISFSSAFYKCPNLIEVPKINNNPRVSEFSSIFNGCKSLKSIPEDWCDGWDWSKLDAQTSQYTWGRSNTFTECYNLRSFPIEFLEHGNPYSNYSSSIYNGLFNECYALDEIVGLPFPHLNTAFTSNAFGYTFNDCYRIKEISFAVQENGTPYVVNWKNQTITLGAKYLNSSSYQAGIEYPIGADSGLGLNYSKLVKECGFTEDTYIYDDATYQALKDNPDSFTFDLNYSRFNKISALKLINTLPDTFAYLAENGGTNTIVFKGQSGALTDGGAINTLTEEEIAVAAAKGWTISLV